MNQPPNGNSKFTSNLANVNVWMYHRSVPNLLAWAVAAAFRQPTFDPADTHSSQQDIVSTWQSGHSHANVNSLKRPIVQGSSGKKRKRWQNRKHRECLVMKINTKRFAAAITGIIDPLGTDPLAFDCSAPAVIPLCHYCICMTYDTYLFFLSVCCHILSSPIWGRIPPYQSGPVFFLLQGSFSLLVLGVKSWVSGKCPETVLTRTDVA